MRFARADEISVDEFEVFDAVRDAACVKGFELAGVRVPIRDDELPASRVGHIVCTAEFVQQALTLDAQSRFQRSGWIVDASVQNAAVVGAGFTARAWVTL